MTDQYLKIAFNKKSIFAKKNGLKLTIPVNVNTLDKLIKSNWNIEYDDNYKKLTGIKNAKEHLKKIRRKIIGGNLNTTLQMKKIGRAYYKNNISLAALNRTARQALQILVSVENDDEYVMENLLYDYDLSNAQPSILYNILKKSNIPSNKFKAIKSYCENRQNWFKLIIERYFKNDKNAKEKAKLLLIKLLNLGDLDTYLKSNCKNFDKDEERCVAIYKKLKLFRIEIYEFTLEYIIPNNKEWFEEIVKEKKDKKSAVRSIISRFLQFYEEQILENVLVQLMKDKVIDKNCFDYAADGFLVPQEIEIETLQKITKDLGWDLKWTIKEPDEGFDIWADVLLNGEDEPIELFKHPEEYLKKFNVEYFKNGLYGQYHLQKDYFERFYTLVSMPEPMFMFSRLVGYTDKYTGETKYRRVITPVKYPEVMKAYQDVYGRIIPAKKEGQEDIEIPFMCDYKKDRFKTHKTEIEFHPNCSSNAMPSCESNYNMFQGYNPVCFEEGIKFDPKSIEKGGVLYDYLKVVKNVMGGEEQAKVFNAHIAHKILYPHLKPRTAICIISTEGVGKNVVLNANAQIIGQFHYISTTNLGDIIGTHAEGIPSKLIVNLNEINFADSSKKKDALKGIVSEDRMRVNAKNVRPYDVDVYALIIATSNNNCCICIDTKNGDRRWIIFESNNKNKKLEKMKMKNGKNRWWYLINKVWSSKHFIQQLYLYYKWLDRYDEIKNYDFTGIQRKLSRSKEYFRLAQYCIPMTSLFLSNYIMNGDCLDGVNYLDDDGIDDYYNYDSFYNPVKITLKKIHKDYEDWYMAMRPNGQFIKGARQFKNELDGFRFKSLSFYTGTGNKTMVEFKPCYLLEEIHTRKFVNVDIEKWDKQKMIGKEEIEESDEDFDDDEKEW
jgi:hypothetical protein